MRVKQVHSPVYSVPNKPPIDQSESAGLTANAFATSIQERTKYRYTGIFTPGIPRMMMRRLRVTRFGFTCGLKTVRGLGIIADRKAAARSAVRCMLLLGS